MYCNGDPVNNTDSNGHLTDVERYVLMATTLVAMAIIIVATGGTGAVAVGAALGLAGGAVIGFGSAGLASILNGSDLHTAASDAADGLVIGSSFGLLSGAGAGTIATSGMAATSSTSITSITATTGNPNAIGKMGEKLAGIDQNAKVLIRINGRIRKPDALDELSLTEVKNVKYISNTLQLRDYADFAAKYNLDKILKVRPNTHITPSVLNAGWKIEKLW